MTSSAIVQKLWNYCNILRDDGLSYLLARGAQASGDYPSAESILSAAEELRTGSEQLTLLLFLKMADEQSRPPYSKASPIPKGYDWPSLLAKDGDDLEIHYRHVLETLGKEKGMLGVIFRKAQNKIQDPAKLRRLIVDLIAAKIVEDLEAALEQFREIATDLGTGNEEKKGMGSLLSKII